MTTQFAINPPNTPLVDQNGNIQPEWYRYFVQQRAQGDQFATGTFVTWTRDQETLGDSRSLQVVAGDLTRSVVDPDIVLGLAATAVTPGSYGGAAFTISGTVDAKGRWTAIAAHALSTTNVAEGTNKYYTDARARAAFSGTAGQIAISAGGVISIISTAVTPGTYGDATHVGQFTVGADGRLTFGGNVAITYPGTSGYTGDIVVGAQTLHFVDGLLASVT